MPIPVNVRSKATVSGHSFARIVGSDHADGMLVCCVFLYVVYVTASRMG